MPPLTSSKKTQEEESLLANLVLMEVSEIPVIGEIVDVVALAGMVFDDIDAYGYNKYISRDAIDQQMTSILTQIDTSLNKIKSDPQENMPSNILATYQAATDDGKKKIINAITSWASVVQPMAKERLECLKQVGPDNMSKNCKLPEYVKSYNNFWNSNLEKYEADYKKALEEYMKEMIEKMSEKNKQDSEPSQQENVMKYNNSLIILICILLLIIVIVGIIIIYRSK